MTRPTRAEAVDQAAAAFDQVLRDMRRNGTLPRMKTPEQTAASHQLPSVERAA